MKVTTTTLAAALDLADRAIPVFPVMLIGDDKVPLIKDWRRRASIDPRQIEEWFSSGDYLIGVPTGASSDFDVLDIDPYNGGDRWLEDHQLPATRWHATRRGGKHFLFRRFEGMRNSTSKIAPGVDVRGEGGFIVYWPAHGYTASADPIADWPDWLAELAMAGRARRCSGQVALDVRKPPSALHVVELLDRMPNPLEVTRDTYVDTMLAAKGCIDALIEAGELDDFEDEVAIGEAAVRWAEKWPGCKTDEAAKWEHDWSHRSAPLAGWQTLSRIAGKLIPGYAAEEFADPPTTPIYQGNPHWPSMLRMTRNGPKANVLANPDIALHYAPEWQGVLALNQFTGSVDVVQPPPYEQGSFGPRPLQELDIGRTKLWLEGCSIDASMNLVLTAIKNVAARNGYHPVRQYLDSLTWDNTPRLDTWLIKYLGVEDTPLNRAYGSRFLISAVARVRNPGCKVDTVPVLEGPQGLMKSTALRTLTDPWFIDHVPDLHSKDAQLQIQGKWLIEFAELGQFGRADANRAKIFISIQEDRFRHPYERVAEDHGRQCVLAVTLNRGAHGYLKDETGNRRFWPIACGVNWPAWRQIDIAGLTHAKGQLWSEADYRYGQHEPWWLHERELLVAHEASVADRLDVGPWYTRVAKAMQSLVERGKPEPSFDEVCGAMGLMSTREVNSQTQLAIGRALTALNWTANRETRDGVRGTFYRFHGGNGGSNMS